MRLARPASLLIAPLGLAFAGSAAAEDLCETGSFTITE